MSVKNVAHVVVLKVSSSMCFSSKWRFMRTRTCGLALLMRSAALDRSMRLETWAKVPKRPMTPSGAILIQSSLVLNVTLMSTTTMGIVLARLDGSEDPASSEDSSSSPASSLAELVPAEGVAEAAEA